MKNILVYISRTKAFEAEPGVLVRIQIDNSLDLGWKREDILLATNFEYEYKGVKSIVVSDDNFLPHSKRESKLMAILELFDRGFIKNRELYWFHDLDAYQSELIRESELEIGKADMALTDYCWRKKWNTGSIFFRKSAEDIIRGIVQTFHLFKSTDEIALGILTKRLDREDEEQLSQFHPKIIEKIPKITNINKRIKKLNTSYNFIPVYKTLYCYNLAIKPIKVVHFHIYGGFTTPYIPNLMNFFMYGNNDIKTVFMSERLIRIFREHDIK